MNGPTESVRLKITETLKYLLTSHGVSLLNQPLRLEGWLRDVHPDLRAPVSVVLECIHTGVYLEKGSIGDVTAMLSVRGGVSPQWSDFGVRIWREVLKGHQLERKVLNVNSEGKMIESSLQTVEMMLGPHRDVRSPTR